MRHLILVLAVLGGGHLLGAAQTSSAALHLEKYETAVKAAADAELQGDSARALGNRRAAEEHLQEARAAYETAGVMTSTEPANLEAYARVLHLLGDYDLAAQALDRAVELSPDDGLLWARLGENRAKVGEMMRDEAFDALQRAVDLAPPSEGVLLAHRTLGDLYWEAGLYEFAGEAYSEALAAVPDDPAARIWQAVLQVRRGEIAPASAVLDALGRDAQPFDLETRMRLRRALRDFEFFRYTYADTPENHAAYGKLLYRAARVPEAMVAIEHALDQAPAQPELWNFLAAMRSQMGDAQGSLDAYSKSLEHNPAQPNVQRAVDQIRQMLQSRPQPPGSQPAGEASSIPPMLRAPE